MITVTTYAYDPMSDLTNRTMPGGLQWQATYNSAGQITAGTEFRRRTRDAHHNLFLLFQWQRFCRIA